MTGLLKYLQHPHYQKNQKIDWVDWVFLFFIYFACGALLAGIINILSHVFPFENKVLNFGGKELFIRAVIIAPFIEECLFRLLLKPKLKNLICYAIVIPIPIVYLLWRDYYFLSSVIMLIECIALFIIIKPKHRLIRVQRKFIKYIPYIFYLFMLSFGLLHILNFTFTKISFWIVLISPLLVAPQIVLGSILGFIRMRFGFFYSVLFHTLVNLIGTLFIILHSLN
ncbi:CPBP family glutamic-type intramembrane protease [Ancylomarina longa]|uniref:CPBP family intramembrane metalloprotease n=1 Tax=Ancylomarina longa TaxID=2487017 RepID=A0A434AEJ4_9BACT|nr:CPBP family intramembrane metalloprotease [Ancylomarina longa]